MKKQNRHHLLSTSWLLALLAFAMLLPQAAQGAQSDTPERQIEAAWERAQASNAYQYRSQLEQTIYPLPKIANAGRQPRQQFIGMEGDVNLSQESLNLTLWQDASFDPNRAVAIRVENGVSYARTGQNEWREVDNVTDLLAPGGDPMGFLGGIKNVSLGEARELNLAGKTVLATQYVFELDGSAFAEQMKQQLEQQLAQQGKLPPGLELASSDAYKTMTGSGELWIDGDGLPLRMVIKADFPQQGEQERITAVITNDYFNYDKTQLGLATTSFIEAPRIWLETRMPSMETAVSFIFFTLLALTLAYFFYAYWRTKALQRVLAALVIVPMIVSPLLRGHVVSAFAAEQKGKQVTWQQQKAEADSQAAARDAEKTTDWRPNEAAAGQLKGRVEETAVLTANQTTLAPVAAADSDGDGLSDTDEVETWNTDPNDPDTDGDGLNDGLEVNELGTAPASADTDSDNIADNLEVGGFSYAGTDWYLDPLEADSNADGLPDGQECLVWVEDSGVYNSSAACPDTDGDGTPDIFTDDNDGDGLLDKYDLNPFDHGSQTFNKDNQFELTINNLEVGQPVYVDLQLVPTNTDNLSLHSSVLDWPTGDTDGQITRYLDTTWATTNNPDLVSSSDNAGNGDIRITPMLELTIPTTTAHYGNLPVNAAYSGQNRPGGEISQWLDAQ